MIDHFSLVLGHGLLALVMLRLVMRDNVDIDPALKLLKDKAQALRDSGSLAGRRAARRERTETPAAEESAD